jgi:hypothetical protein
MDAELESFVQQYNQSVNNLSHNKQEEQPPSQKKSNFFTLSTKRQYSYPR